MFKYYIIIYNIYIIYNNIIFKHELGGWESIMTIMTNDHYDHDPVLCRGNFNLQRLCCKNVVLKGWGDGGFRLRKV